MWGQPPSPALSKRSESNGAVWRSEAPLPSPSRRYLLLEEVLERLPRVARPLTGGRRRLLLPGHAYLIRWAVVARIFLRNPLLDRLHALEPASRIEIHALLAGMQLKAALRALPRRSRRIEHCSALGAARHRPRPRQIHRPRPKCVVPPRWTARAFRWRLPRSLTPRLFTPRFPVAVLITRLTIFRHRPSNGQYCLPDAARAQVPYTFVILSAPLLRAKILP
jgi:hypothetical protein